MVFVGWGGDHLGLPPLNHVLGGIPSLAEFLLGGNIANAELAFMRRHPKQAKLAELETDLASAYARWEQLESLA